ncbi:SWIM zinc finger family protein [Chondrinema litorale]|uniref:SWIM zinc finger family protein n=1 Tax=Chondrinema litorale TaxID=2994555 RepID=UPI002542D117|nr:SWIM zinc finger family protein [Chondrinema litorale]UZS00158.1 SWIM zinc finger domain-containing protein [Chondrinema litorale]
MSDTISYHYSIASGLKKQGNTDELLLAKYSEVEKKDAPCFFWGRLNDPYITARCLITLSNTVKSSFNLSPFQIAMLKDPIVTAGNEKIRFEGFSHCAGVYARVDVLPGGHDGEFLENGTTNVDFNQGMISALSSVRKKEDVLLSVGQKEVALHKNGEKVVEKKVPLPTKWIKGLTTVQLYLADTEEVFRMNRIQAVQFIRSIPKGKPKTDYYLGMRGNRPVLSPAKMENGVCIGGVHRLRLLEQLVPLADELRVFAHKTMQSTTWQLYFGDVRFTFSLSRDAWRGFSGEGAALASLIEDVPEALISRFDNFSFANQEFNPTMMAIEENIGFKDMNNLATRLSAMGLLGFDLDENSFFYRRLPFNLSRITSLNPRMKEAEKLLADDKVSIVSHTAERVEALVEGSGIHHTVLLEGNKSRCTCTWYARHQGERGICKHILAVKKKIS